MSTFQMTGAPHLGYMGQTGTLTAACSIVLSMTVILRSIVLNAAVMVILTKIVFIVGLIMLRLSDINEWFKQQNDCFIN